MDIEPSHSPLAAIGRCAVSRVLVLLLALPVPLFAQHTGKPTESAHVSGPHDLEGWTLNWPVPDSGYEDQPFAFTLVVARHGKILHRIEGEPIIWNWMFWGEGAQVAYETGPFHFGMTCVLAEVKTGRTLKTFDCYHGLPANAPDWVVALHP